MVKKDELRNKNIFGRKLKKFKNTIKSKTLANLFKSQNIESNKAIKFLISKIKIDFIQLN